MVLKETLSYYTKNNSFVFCTFLDATKAFDRVNYCKLFRLLIQRDLPACIIRILIKLYTEHSVRVLWAGVASDYFSAINGVKQGGVLSPVLFCVYINDLLINLSKCGAGCFIGSIFVGALAYADDVVLLAPTPSAMRKLLAVCDSFASDYDIVFNASKSNYLVVAPSKRRDLRRQMEDCVFFVGGKRVERVESYTHLGHIINHHFDDSNDVIHRRNAFIGQANNVLCYFSKMDMLVKIKLFNSYCTSLYGCELWSLHDSVIDEFCIAWRKALRRLLNLPYNTHSYLLPLLSNTLPAFVEICKRSARFVFSCLNSRSSLVRAVAWHGVDIARYDSCIGQNLLFCCNYFKWKLSDFIDGNIVLDNDNFSSFCFSQNSDFEISSAISLFEVLLVREGVFKLENFTRTELDNIIAVMSNESRPITT